MANKVQRLDCNHLMEKFQLKEEQLLREITQQHRLDLSLFALDDWKKFARKTNLTTAEIQAIGQDGTSEEDRRYKTLEKWHQRSPETATYKQLIDIFLSMQEGSTAIEICRLLIPKKEGEKMPLLEDTQSEVIGTYQPKYPTIDEKDVPSGRSKTTIEEQEKSANKVIIAGAAGFAAGVTATAVYLGQQTASVTIQEGAKHITITGTEQAVKEIMKGSFKAGVQAGVVANPLNYASPISLASGLTQATLETVGFKKTGKTVGAVGNATSGALVGVALLGPIGIVPGVIGGLAVWGVGEVIGSAVGTSIGTATSWLTSKWRSNTSEPKALPANDQGEEYS